MVCLRLKPGVAGWKVQTNPLTFGDSVWTGPNVQFGQTLGLHFCAKVVGNNQCDQIGRFIGLWET